MGHNSGIFYAPYSFRVRIIGLELGSQLGLGLGLGLGIGICVGYNGVIPAYSRDGRTIPYTKYLPEKGSKVSRDTGTCLCSSIANYQRILP